MGQINRLEVIDREGWRHDFALEKAVVHLGSDSRNDIILDSTRGGNVAPLHAQLILSTLSNETTISRAQLVNLADTDIALGSANGDMLPPRSATELSDGVSFRIGDFTLIFHGTGVESGSSPVEKGGQNIGLSLHLPRTRLEPNRFIDGVVKVMNGGDRGGAQIELQLEGLADTCYDLEPGPVLSSGAEREVLLRIYHRGSLPLAGSHHIVVRAAAPKVYPGDEATASVKIDVAPLYSFSMRLLAPEKLPPACVQVVKPQMADSEAPSKPVEVKPPAVEELAIQPPVPTESTRVEQSGTAGEDWWAPTTASIAAPKSVEDRPTSTAPETVPPVDGDSPAPAEQAQAAIAGATEIVSEPPVSEVETVPGGTEAEVTGEEPLLTIDDAPAPAPPPVESKIDGERVPVEKPAEDESAPPDEVLPSPWQADTVEVRFPTSATAQAPQGAAAPDAAGVREPAVSDTSRPDEEVETQVKVSTGATEDSGRVLSVSTGQPDPVSTPSGPADVDSLTADVWWQTTTPHSGSEAEDPAERRVLKLKASKPQEKDTPRPTQPVSEVPPQAWWIPESETDLTAMPEGPIAGQAVLKMKAEQPPVQDPANQPAAPDKPLPHADDEDWWSPSTKIEEDLDA